MGSGTVLTIDSTNVADPAECRVDIEDIHAEDSGRNEAGEMIIRIIARKRKLFLKWNQLSFSDGATLTNLFESGTYHTVYYWNPPTGTFISGSFYCGARSSTMFNKVKQIWESIEFNLIEK